MFRRLAPLLLCLFALLGTGPALAQQADVQTSWRLLDYIAVDYPGAVQGGKIVSAAEYKEMAEFAGSVRERIGALPARPAKARLRADADGLQAAIRRAARPSMPRIAPPATAPPAWPTPPPRASSSRGRSPSPTATAPAIAACLASIR
jgi:high-affinity iron transporter